MGNIVGEQFENYVLNQISVRQKLYGSGVGENSLRNQNQIQLLNNKQAWLKMASSVSVIGNSSPSVFNKTSGEYIDANISSGEKRLRDIGITNTDEFVGSGLAKKTVLFNTLSSVNPTSYDDDGTTVEISGSYNFRSGVSKANSLWNNSNSYGLGGTNKGLVPAPGLISFTMDSQNRGSIRKGTIELKCYNRFQFELIELVYLRLGFTMMIEWGWDKFTTNGKDIQNVGNTIIEDKWFQNNTNMTQLEMINSINAYQRLYQGNYDGFYGRVTNFNWSYDTDGTYGVSIDLISVGDVIESLVLATKSTALSVKEINATTGSSAFEDTGLTADDSPIVSNAGSTALSQDMFTDILGQKWDAEQSDFTNPSLYFNQFESSQKANEAGSLDKYNYYMTFGELIRKLETFCVPKLLNDFGEASEMIYFDSNADTNLCVSFPNQISLDPRVCLIKPPLAINSQEQNSTTWLYNNPGWARLKPFAQTQDFGDKTVIYGQIMNIYLNYDFISKLLAKATDTTDRGKQVSIFSFLTNVCDGINDALGGINNLEVALKNDNTITIIEQNTIPGIEALSFNKGKMNSIPSFNVYGVKQDKGSFVTDFNFDTKITPELATMISVGATAGGGNTKDYDSTSFSKWNDGLYDRYNKEFIDPALDAILKEQLALSEQANELGITSFRDITSLQATQLYNAWTEGEEDRGHDEVVQDAFNAVADGAYTAVEGLGHATDATAEFATDIYNTVGNWIWRDDDEQVSTFGTDNVGNITNPDLSERRDENYSQNKTFKACGVENQGYRIALVNSVYPFEGSDTNGGLNWEEYVKKVADYLHAEKMKKITGEMTHEELAAKFSNNYIFYLTRILGGDFAAGTNDSPGAVRSKDKIGYTAKNKYAYFLYNDAIIKEGKSAFNAYVTTINNTLYQKTGAPSGLIGFIPIDMNLTFEGLSGVKIYNQINVQQGFLPSQYPRTYKFLVSKVNHAIEENSWSTTIDTITIPRTFVSGKFNFSELSEAADTYVTGGGNGKPEYLGPTPNADRVREYIKPIPQIEEKLSGQDGGGGYTVGIDADGNYKGELTSGGDISSAGADMTIAVLQALRTEAPDIRITLTAGNDLYHHNKVKNYTSRHEVGNAIDFTINNPTATNLDLVKKVLNSFIVGPKNWYYLDEYGEPTAVASGAHFHLSLPTAERAIKGSDPRVNQEVLNAQAQFNAGQISKRP